jgi:RNA polymerase sigma-70 factor (ECF subfamily)
VALSEIDRKLLGRCLARKPRAWEDFVDRFMGLVIHVISHSCSSRSIRCSPADVEDLAAEVFLAVIRDDFAVLRRFRGESSLATYLTVVARRVVVRELLAHRAAAHLNQDAADEPSADTGPSPEQRITNEDEVQRLLASLDGAEAEVVRMYHLEGKSYHQISRELHMPENSVGPTLTRARTKMRRASTDSAAG